MVLNALAVHMWFCGVVKILTVTVVVVVIISFVVVVFALICIVMVIVVAATHIIFSCDNNCSSDSSIGYHVLFFKCLLCPVRDLLCLSCSNKHNYGCGLDFLEVPCPHSNIHVRFALVVFA